MTSVKFSPNALKQLFYIAERDKKLFKNFKKIIEDTQRNGISGLGRPEPLKENLSGWYSKHIDEGNRIVFRIIDGIVEVSACYTHYQDK